MAKNDIVPISKNNGAANILQKMVKPTISPTSPRGPNEGLLYMICSTHKNREFVFLTRPKGEITELYDVKRIKPGATGSKTATARPQIKGAFDFREGLTAECPWCANPHLFGCDCGTYSCSGTERHTCPNCKEKSQAKDWGTLTEVTVSTRSSGKATGQRSATKLSGPPTAPRIGNK